jgi:hypothetical protein
MTETTPLFLFAGSTYYPNGGMLDFIGTFESVEDAENALRSPEPDEDGYTATYDWWHIAAVVDGKLTIVKTHRG